MSKKSFLFLSFIMASSLMLCAIAEGAQQYTLTVSKAGSGTGTVTSSPAGINCGSDCSTTFNQGTKITLKVKADPGSTFTGWSGGCTGTSASCKLTMNSDQTVTATFGLPDLRGELSDISVKLSKSIYEISGKLTVYADEGKAAGVNARVFLSHDETYYQDGDLLGLITIGTINAGSSKSKSFKYKGTYNPSGMYVVAVIDPDNIVQESNDKNNIAASYYRGEAPQLEVTLDESSRVSAVLQYGEGTLETTSGSSNLILTLLWQSLMGSPEISLTGVSEIKGLPETITMLAGAQLGPEGTRLLKPATLTIGLPPGAPTEGLIGFLSQDNGRKFQFYPIEVNGSTATFEMMHFTSVGVGGITCSDISTLGNPSWLSGQALAEYRIAIAGAKCKLNCDHLEDVTLWDAYMDEMAGILEDWYFGKGGVLEQLMYVPENPEDYMLIVYQFVRWVKFTELIGIQERGLTKEQPCGLWSGENCRTFDDLERGGKDAIINTIRNGIIAANKACLDGDSTKDAIALKWLLIAENLQRLGFYLFKTADATELWELKTCGIYSLEVSPSQATIDVGGTIQLQAIAKDKAGDILSGYSVDWLSSDKAIAVVDKNSGLVTGVKGGTTFVSAFLRQNFLLSAYADITVSSFATSLHYYMTTQPSCHAERQEKRVGDTILLKVIGRDPRGSESTAGFSVTWSHWDERSGCCITWPAGSLSSSQGQEVVYTLDPPGGESGGRTVVQANIYDDATGALVVKCPLIVFYCQSIPSNWGGWCGGPVCCACNYTGPLQFTDNPVKDVLRCPQ